MRADFAACSLRATNMDLSVVVRVGTNMSIIRTIYLTARPKGWWVVSRGQARDSSGVYCNSLTEGGARLCPSGLAGSTPQTFPAASRPPASTLPEVQHQVGARLSRFVRFRARRKLRGVMTSVSRVLLSGLLTGPAPGDGPSAPRLCQGYFHPSLDGLSSVPAWSLRRPGGGLSSPLESTATTRPDRTRSCESTRRRHAARIYTALPSWLTCLSAKNDRCKPGMAYRPRWVAAPWETSDYSNPTFSSGVGLTRSDA